ncbi:hypothetical protein V6N11_036633 [Hibiscus sabdariffa]|uniref:Yippee domain-containing protein n=1 Tax=Hibiscus sabdariffa TaxID=183260 RepID=A0ABR2RBF9_9ROSI
MGKVFMITLEGSVYSCKHCHTHLALLDDIISKCEYLSGREKRPHDDDWNAHYCRYILCRVWLNSGMEIRVFFYWVKVSQANHHGEDIEGGDPVQPPPQAPQYPTETLATLGAIGSFRGEVPVHSYRIFTLQEHMADHVSQPQLPQDD